MRQSEHHVEIAGRQDPLLSRLEPRRLCKALAFGAMPVAAGIVGGHLVSTRRADVEVPTQNRRPAAGDGPDGRALLGRQDVAFAVAVTEGAEDIRHLQARPSLPARGRTRLFAHGALPECSRCRGAQHVQRTSGACDVRLADRCVARSGLDRCVAQEPLDGANVFTRLQ